MEMDLLNETGATLVMTYDGKDYTVADDAYITVPYTAGEMFLSKWGHLGLSRILPGSAADATELDAIVAARGTYYASIVTTYDTWSEAQCAAGTPPDPPPNDYRRAAMMSLLFRTPDDPLSKTVVTERMQEYLSANVAGSTQNTIDATFSVYDLTNADAREIAQFAGISDASILSDTGHAPANLTGGEMAASCADIADAFIKLR